jgi:hypothetical protein
VRVAARHLRHCHALERPNGTRQEHVAAVAVPQPPKVAPACRVKGQTSAALGQRWK